MTRSEAGISVGAQALTIDNCMGAVAGFAINLKEQTLIQRVISITIMIATGDV